MTTADAAGAPRLDILLVDDEPALRLALADALTAAGHRVETAADGAVAASAIRARVYDVVICDLILPKISGMALFRMLKQGAPDTDVLLISAHGSVEDAVRALKEGATDFLSKPFEVAQLIHDLDRIALHRELRRQLRELRRLTNAPAADAMLGRASSMMRVFKSVEIIAESDAPVLILGDSGTGKELVARRLHRGSPRASRPFVAINCAAFPETLIEAELFGHERGAFTGAVRRREGRFKVADQGSLFLDEVAELPLPAQAKLLRVLQDGYIQPIGSDVPTRVDVRIISATHRALRDRVAAGTFREDLYYRLKVMEIRLPPLRERPGDLPILVDHFIRRFSRSEEIPGVTPRAWAALSEYPFPGNVRELEHAIHHGVVLAAGEDIDLWHLPQDISGLEDPIEIHSDLQPLTSALKAFEREYLKRALERTGGNRGQAAKLLGISRKNLWEKLRAHGMGAKPGKTGSGAGGTV